MECNVDKNIEEEDAGREDDVFTYSVISYDDGDLEAVPTVWLNSTKSKCYWPPKSYKNVTLLIKHCAKPNQDWQLYDCTLIKQYGSYADAKRKVNKLVDSCSSSTSSQEFGKGHRRKRATVRTMSIENSELAYMPPITETQERADDVSLMNLSNLPVSFLTDNVETNRKIDQLLATVDILLKEVASLKIEIKENNKLIQNFRNASDTTHDLNDDETNKFKFPIQNLSEFNVVNQELVGNEDSKKEFVYKMKLLMGGKSDDFVRRMLDRCFSKEFATKVAWTSAKGNIPIGESKIITYMDLICRKYSDPNYTAVMFKTCVSGWLRNATSRLKKSKPITDSASNLTLDM